MQQRVAGWTRPVKAVALLGAMLTVGALTALAILIVTATSAPDTFQAKAIGNVDIGNVASDGLLVGTKETAALTLEPGDSLGEICILVKVANPQPGDDVRLYIDSVVGPLSDDILLLAEVVAASAIVPPVVDPAGHLASCPVSGLWSPINSTEAVSLDAWQTNHSDWVTGEPMLDDAGTVYRFFFSLDSGADAGVIAGESVDLTLAWENQN